MLTAPRLRESVRQARELGVPVAIDMALVTFIDSSGLSALIAGAGVANGLANTVRIQQPSDKVRHLLELTGLDKVFPISV